jgi:cell division protein DivIC
MARVSAPPWVGPGLLFLFVIPLFVYSAYSIGDRWYQGYVLTQQEEAIRADVLRLREENLRLQRALAEARSDAGIESIAREQLGLVKPGDTAIQIEGPAPAGAAVVGLQATPAPQAQPTREKPGWLRFLDAIFGR